MDISEGHQCATGERNCKRCAKYTGGWGEAEDGTDKEREKRKTEEKVYMEGVEKDMREVEVTQGETEDREMTEGDLFGDP